MDTYNLPPITLEDCHQWHLYNGGGRNIFLTVCTQKGIFMGIRSKFESEYLDTEWYYGPTSGTYRPAKDLGVLSYKAIKLWEDWFSLSIEANKHYRLWYDEWMSWEQPTTKEERETFNCLRDRLVEKANYDVLSKKTRIAHGRILTWLKNQERNLSKQI